MKSTLNENIAALRKEKGMTQEELAAKLGVSGQAVSKWESGACCPDIGLLPVLADVFGVTMDELMGRTPPSNEYTEDLIETVCRYQSGLPREAAAVFACQVARVLHARLFAEYVNMPNPDDVITHAKTGEWGLSVISDPNVTTRMYRDAVFFSANGEYGATNLTVGQIKQLSCFLREITKEHCLPVLFALYRLTVRDESAYVSAEAIGQISRMRTDRVLAALEDELSEIVICRDSDSGREWRIGDECMDVVPILSLLIRL